MNLKTILGLERGSVRLKNGDRITLKPLTVKQAFIIERIYAPVADGFVEKGIESLEVQAEQADNLIGVIATATGKTVAYVEEMDRDDFNKLFSKLLEIERDFFVALMAQAALRAQQKSSPTGQSSFSA